MRIESDLKITGITNPGRVFRVQKAVLVNAFAQERLFIGYFAAWLAVCAFFSHYQRGHWAYACVLSGYTAAIVGIPAALTQDSAFDVISSRAENVIIGILFGTRTSSALSREAAIQLSPGL